MDVVEDDFPSVHWGDGWIGPPFSGWSQLIAGVLMVVFVVTLAMLLRHAT